jgi:hypothetical protein
MQKAFLAMKQWSWLAVGMMMVGGALLTSQHVAAADTSERSSIALSPVSQRFDVKAGTSADNKITVINDGTTDLTFLVYSRPYSLQNEQYDPNFERVTPNTDVYQWIRFAQTSFTLAAGDRLDIPYTMQVPATAAPGGHYGVIFVETQPAAGSGDSVVRKKRVGSLMLVNVDGTLINKGQLMSTKVNFWQTTPPLMASSRVQNTGNTDFQATVLLTVTDLFGSVKYRATQDYTVYPGTIRLITSQWTDAPWFGLFKAQQTVTVLGKVTAQTNYVLLMPRWLPLTLLAAIVVGVGYEILRRKRHH